ncbi:hypothetical protein [Alienimonas californiensis]|uniref:HEAT repeat domain-containing protein n=1 Tax=Alienimonas californiensis TaxID=2527989 RepID=A0A517P6Y1_9PLAN|nr:hypothetical protein [Alienimonas californiensis]QDT15124.1 hypothetical protein CA12_12050 [Alienimonas californiensis]
MQKSDRLAAEIVALCMSDDDAWPLETLLADLWATGEADRHRDALFDVLERRPLADDHASNTLRRWLEILPGGGQALVASARRRPSLMTTRMLNRFLNGGIASIEGTSLLDLLGEVRDDPTVPGEVREEAADCLAWQQERTATGGSESVVEVD